MCEDRRVGTVRNPGTRLRVPLTEAQIDVPNDELMDALPVLAGKRLDGQVAVSDQRIGLVVEQRGANPMVRVVAVGRGDQRAGVDD